LKVGGEIFLFDFFRENGSQGTTKTISAGIFAVIIFFHPFLGGWNLGVKFFIRFFCENGSQWTTWTSWTTKMMSAGVFAVKTFFTPFWG